MKRFKLKPFLLSIIAPNTSQFSNCKHKQKESKHLDILLGEVLSLVGVSSATTELLAFEGALSLATSMLSGRANSPAVMFFPINKHIIFFK